MKLKHIILAVEDELGEAVSTQLLKRFDIEIWDTVFGEGYTYLQRKAVEFNRSASGAAIFMLTDLDSPQNCPPRLIQSWIKGALNPQFFFRVAVMEVESWVMADRDGIANFLSIPVNRIPRNTDEIPNPKEFLVSLARRSQKRTVREALIPDQRSILPVGNEYNTFLSEFVRDHWNLERAATASPSLKRTLDRLAQGKNMSADQ